MTDHFTNVPLIISKYLLPYYWEQYRFPRSKKKRIRKKWAKDRKNWRQVHKPVMFEVGGNWLMDQKTFDKVQERLRQIENRIITDITEQGLPTAESISKPPTLLCNPGMPNFDIQELMDFARKYFPERDQAYNPSLTDIFKSYKSPDYSIPFNIYHPIIKGHA